MWIFLNDAFLSIVSPTPNSFELLVRARFEGDIQRVFPEAQVITTDTADYRFRAMIHRDRVSQVMADEAHDIDYDNFKNSVAEDDRHMTYLRVWSVMALSQEAKHGPQRKPPKERKR